jgi:hypothetical protein
VSQLKVILPQRAQNSFTDFDGDLGSFENIANGILEDSDFSKLSRVFRLVQDIYEVYLLQDLINLSISAAEFRAGSQGEDYIYNTGRRDGLRRLQFHTASDIFDDYLKLVERVAEDQAQYPSLDYAELEQLQPELTNLDKRMFEIAKDISRDDIAVAAASAYKIEFRSLSDTIAYWLKLARNSEDYQKKSADAQSQRQLEISNCTPEQLATLKRGGINWCFQLFEFALRGEERKTLVLWETNIGAIGLPFYPKKSNGDLVSIWPDEVPFCHI